MSTCLEFGSELGVKILKHRSLEIGVDTIHGLCSGHSSREVFGDDDVG